MERDETDLENRGVKCKGKTDRDENWTFTVRAKKIEEKDIELCKLEIPVEKIWKVGTLGEFTDWICELEQCKDRNCTNGNGCVANDLLTVGVIAY